MFQLLAATRLGTWTARFLPSGVSATHDGGGEFIVAHTHAAHPNQTLLPPSLAP
jgi:hypothetical protein